MKNHDSNEVSCNFAGIPIETGRGEIGGEFLKINYLSDAFGDTASLDGEATRYPTHDQRADISLFIMSTSQTNAFLSALHKADKLIPGGAGVGAFGVIDRQSQGTLYFAEHCWIMKAPEHSIGEKPVLLEWKLRAAKLESFIAGN